MNLKKFFAGALSLAMAISAVNFSYAEPTGDFVNVGGTFAENVSGFEKKDMGTVNFLEGISHSDDGTGSLKFEGRTWQGTTGSRVAAGKTLANLNLEIGETYLAKAYVYGERINAEDYVRMEISSGYNTNDNQLTKYVSGDIKLEQNGWTEISQYFIATDKIGDFKLIFPKMTTTGGNDANAETYGIVYIDDVTIEKQTDADDFFDSLTYGPKVKYAKDTVINKSFQKLDLTKTKNVLTENEAVDLKAYLQDCASGQTVADLVRTAADKQYITVSTSNRGVAAYENGQIIAKGCGTAVITASYNDGTTTASSKLLVTVHPNNADSFILGKGTANYATVTDPIDSDSTARIILTKEVLNSSVLASKPAVISFGIYNPAGPDENTKFVNIVSKFGSGNYINFADNRWVSHQLGWQSGMLGDVNRYGIAGWEDVDIVIDYPLTNSYEEGYRLIDFYLNGNKAFSYEDKITNLDGYFGINAGGNSAVMLRDLSIVSMDTQLKVQYTNPAEGESLSTLDDIDVIFNQQVKIADEDSCAALYKGDEKIETVKVLESGNKKLSVIPQGGLKVNTKYTLRLNADSFTNTIGEKLAGTTEFTFVTTNEKVSDVVGSGYKLLTSQINVIENGSFKMSATKSGRTTVYDADKPDNATLHLPSGTDNDRSISIPFDDSFKTNKISADRIILEFDTKVVSVLNTDKTAPTDHQQEGWWISGQDASGNTGSLTKLGYDRTWGNPFGLWTAQFAINDNENRQNGSTSGTYAVNKDIQKIESNIDNLGYVHVKIVYDFKQNDPKGDVLQTVTVNGGGIAFEKTVCSALFSGYPNAATLSDFTLFARNLAGSYGDVYASKDTYLKNLNVYALKEAPELIPDAEIKNITVIDDNADPIESAEGLKDKKVYVSAKLKNNKLGGNTSYVLVAAAYDKATNKLIDVVIGTPGTVNNGEEVQGLEFEDELDLSTFTGEAEIRVFAWNSMEGAMPLTDVYKPF